MTTTATQICNKAMRKIRHNQSLSDNWYTTQTTLEDETCFAFYDDVRQTVLRMADWACSIKRITLDADSGIENLTGKAYAFDLPKDYLRRVDVEDGNGKKIPFMIEGSFGYTDATDSVVLVYVYDDKNPAHWDRMLVEAMVLQLASEIAYPLAGDVEKVNQLAASAMQIAEETIDQTRREHRTGTPSYREWSPGLFENRRS